jgi:hypothetical protein
VDIMGLKLDIINAAFTYGQAMERLGQVSDLPMNHPSYVPAVKEASAKFQELYNAINQLDALVEEK